MTDSTDNAPWYKTVFERDWFDVLAPGGANGQDNEAFAERTARETAFVAAVLQGASEQRILDLRMGPPHGFRVTGLDLSAYHCELARQRASNAGAPASGRYAFDAFSRRNVCRRRQPLHILRLLRRRRQPSAHWRKSLGFCALADVS